MIFNLVSFGTKDITLTPRLSERECVCVMTHESIAAQSHSFC